MQLSLLTFSVAILIGALTPAALADNVYVEGLVGSIDSEAADVQRPQPALDFKTLGVRAGYELNETFAIESELLLSPQQETIDNPDPYSNLDVDLHSHAAIFGRISAPVSERISMHGRFGYGSMELSNSVAGVGPNRYIDTYAGPAYGLGAKLTLTDRVYLRSDYTEYASNLRQSGVFTVGAGVNLFQVAKLVNELRD